VHYWLHYIKDSNVLHLGLDSLIEISNALPLPIIELKYDKTNIRIGESSISALHVPEGLQTKGIPLTPWNVRHFHVRSNRADYAFSRLSSQSTISSMFRMECGVPPSYSLDVIFSMGFGISSEWGPSIDPDINAWFMPSFTLTVRTLRVLGGSLLKSDHAPGNENSSIAVSKSTGWSASIGPTLQPTPPFASLEASLTYSAQTQLTETIPNLSCNFANDDYACVEWQIELSHYNKYRGHRGKPFVSTDFTKVKVGGIPREAFAEYGKNFKVTFQVTQDDLQQPVECIFLVTTRVWAHYSADSGPEDMMQLHAQKPDGTYEDTQFYYKYRKVDIQADDDFLFKRIALQQQRLVNIIVNASTMYHHMEVEYYHQPQNYYGSKYI